MSFFEKNTFIEVFFFCLSFVSGRMEYGEDSHDQKEIKKNIGIEGKRDFMITIYGKYTNAIVYTTENEQYALDEYARASSFR